MAVEHQRVDHREVAHLVEETRRVVLQVEVGVPHDHAVECDRVPPGVHESERHVVAAHEDRQWIVARDSDRKRGVPPCRIGKAAFFVVAQDEPALAQVVFLPECTQRIQRTPQILAARFELHPLALFAEHRAVHAELLIDGVRKERHGANQRLALERDVVVHEQHVCCPALRAQPHEATREPAGAAEVGVRHHREVVTRCFIKLHVVGVVDHEHADATAQRIVAAHEREHFFHRRHHVGVAIERGDREIEAHVASRCARGTPFDAMHSGRRVGDDAHEEHPPARLPQRANPHVDRLRAERRARHDRLATPHHRDHFRTPRTLSDDARLDVVDGRQPTPAPGMQHAERRVECECRPRPHRRVRRTRGVDAESHVARVARVQLGLGKAGRRWQRALQQVRHRAIVTATGR